MVGTVVRYGGTVVRYGGTVRWYGGTVRWYGTSVPPYRTTVPPYHLTVPCVELVTVRLGNQAHQNRPKSGTTGGLLVFINDKNLTLGLPAPMTHVAWKS